MTTVYGYDRMIEVKTIIYNIESVQYIECPTVDRVMV